MGDRRLGSLENHRVSLETCLYCPKLCRVACPVSREQGRESVTPGAKMSAAYLCDRGDLPDDAAHAALSWACTTCFGCRERCDHRNDVATTLLSARAKAFLAGNAPEGARRVAAKHGDHDSDLGRATALLMATKGVRQDSSIGLLLGCSYVLRAPKEARDAIVAVTSLLRAPVSLVDRCCGLPLLLAGDEEGFAHAARGMALRLSGYERLIVVDAGCAQAIRQRYDQHGVKIGIGVQTLVELAHEHPEMIGPLRQQKPGPVRYHDSCQMGRGLGLYDAPRDVLRWMLGRECDEFSYAKEMAYCCGAGGLLPVIDPETANGIARQRVAEHESLGGGHIVTACGSSLSILRKAGGKVDDLSTLIARAVRPWEDGTSG